MKRRVTKKRQAKLERAWRLWSKRFRGMHWTHHVAAGGFPPNIEAEVREFNRKLDARYPDARP